MSYTYKYARPALTVDCVVFGCDLEEENLKILLIQRYLDPFSGKWALPGGFVNVDEPLDAAALRELQEETGMKDIYIEQLSDRHCYNPHRPQSPDFSFPLAVSTNLYSCVYSNIPTNLLNVNKFQ